MPTPNANPHCWASPTPIPAVDPPSDEPSPPPNTNPIAGPQGRSPTPQPQCQLPTLELPEAGPSQCYSSMLDLKASPPYWSPHCQLPTLDLLNAGLLPVPTPSAGLPDPGPPDARPHCCPPPPHTHPSFSPALTFNALLDSPSAAMVAPYRPYQTPKSG